MLILEERGVKIEHEIDLRAARGEDGEEKARSLSHPEATSETSSGSLAPSAPPLCPEDDHFRGVRVR